MPPSFKLHTETDFAQAIKHLFEQLDQRLELSAPVTAYIAGGVAVHLYTAYRVSSDIDAEFSHRLLIPDDLVIEVPATDGIPQLLHFDKQYNSTFALMHEDYQRDSVPVPFDVPHFHIRALSPVDLAVSKISRFQDHDQRDIQMLVSHGLTKASAIEARARQALPGFVGNMRWLEINIKDAVRLALQAELEQLGYDIASLRAAEPDKVYSGLVISVLSQEIIQSTPQGLVSHARRDLIDGNTLVAGRHVDISYTSNGSGTVKSPAGVPPPRTRFRPPAAATSRNPS